MQNRPPAPSHYDIAVYWSQDDRRLGFVDDLGEPSCFACGWWYDRATDYVSIRVTWASAKLERAHLKPYSRGGTCDVSNYVLLCNPCHTEAPDWAEADEMLRWVQARESFASRMQSDFARAWQEVRPGQPHPEDFDQEMLLAQLRNFATLHAGRLAMATIAVAAARAAEATSEGRLI